MPNNEYPEITKAGIDRLSEENDRIIQALRAQGVGIEQVNLVSTRLLMLTEQLLGDLADPRRLAFEHALQLRYAKMLAEVRSQVTRARLMQGVNLNGSSHG